MSAQQLIGLLPLAAPAVGAILVMLAGALGVGRQGLYALTTLALSVSVVALAPAASVAPLEITPLLQVDDYALFFLALLYVATGIVSVLSRSYLESRSHDPEAFWTLLLLATCGMGVLACSAHFVSFFLGLEILTIALYAMIGYARETRGSLEAAFKYLILAALSSGLLLFGVALIYAATGTLLIRPALAGVADLSVGAEPGIEATWAVSGTLLLLVGFGFKLALVPFHMWSPDVYQGAPVPVTSLIATGSKGAVLAVLLRALAPGDVEIARAVVPALAVIAVATMFAGNLLALFQDDVKRLLAYSSVAHLGYVLVGIVAGGTAGAEAVTFYILTYVVMTLGAFGVVTLLSTGPGADVEHLQAYRGLGRRSPLLAGVLTVMLLSLAGIPPTGGFVAKFAVLAATVDAGRWGLAVAMVLASGLGIFYYLRVIVAMYMQPGIDRSPLPARAPASVIAVVGLVAVVILLGLWPTPWLAAVGRAVAAVIAA